MAFRLLADLTVSLHLAFVLFVALGGLLVLRWPWLIWAHLPAAVWGVAIEFTGWLCPLTTLEKHFRERAGEAGYPGGFIEHYILAVLYPAGLTRNVQFLLGASALIINAAIYWRFFRRRRPAGGA